NAWAGRVAVSIRARLRRNRETKRQKQKEVAMAANFDELIQRYNVAAPRYTSYPTVPYWDPKTCNTGHWIEHVWTQYVATAAQGISLYIHLPFCERLCTYCGCNTRITRDHSVETPYVDAVLKEWFLYRNYLGLPKIPIRELHLGGGTPTFFAPKQLERLVQGLLYGSRTTRNTEFSFEAHPANTTTEHLQVLHKLGFKRLSLGIQDFDERVQKIINRRQTEADVHRVMDQARQIGYTSINFDLIYGLPLQTPEGVQATVEK